MADSVSTAALAVLRAHGMGIPLTFRVDENGHASVSSQRLSLRFIFLEDTISIEEEVFDDLTFELTHTIGQLSIRDENDCKMWRLAPGRYRVYGLTDSQMAASTEILTPSRSSTCTMHTPLPTDVKVKVEPGPKTPLLAKVKVEPGTFNSVITLSSDDDDSPRRSTPLVPSPPNHSVQSKSPVVVSDKCLPLQPPSSCVCVSIVDCLKKLATRPGKKNLLKKLDYSSIRHERVQYLPAIFNGDVMFELPLAGTSASQTQAKSMQGMDKRYDGHVWTKTITTNITNDMGLSFRFSSCVGHLRCENKECAYLTREHRIFEVNETEFDGCTLQAFVVGQGPPKYSTLVCKVCKEPPACLATCRAKIYYVIGQA